MRLDALLTDLCFASQRAQLMIELVPALIEVGKAREALEEITL